MKNFNADSPVIRLQVKRKALTTELNNLKREITSHIGTERKKRALLKQIDSTEKKITDLNNLIKEEKKRSKTVYSKRRRNVSHTTTKIRHYL